VRPLFYAADLVNKEKLATVFQENSIDAVIHFAGLKAVGESVAKPLAYYRNNLDSTLSLLEVMDKFNVRKLVFSSSATVYGLADVPYTESATIGMGVTSPYGQTKFFIEQILKDTATSNDANQFVSLRYFNPVGAHPSGLMGEDPKGIPNNLMPFISQVASGKRDQLAVFGDDYPTADGTCERDFIHVEDLARTVGRRIVITKHRSWSRLPLATWEIKGIKLFGMPFGSSPIRPLGCAPTGLK
jgi:UDP-glucose 4-epimerase